MQIDKQKEYLDNSQQEPLVEEVLKHISSGLALDLGPGSGRDSMFLAAHGFNVTAVDNDKIHLSTLNKKCEAQELTIRLINTDINDYVPDTGFDVIVCNMVLHFFTPKQIQTLITKMQSWTNPRGVNVVVAYSDKNPVGKRPYLFKPNELKDFYKRWDMLTYEEKPTPWFKLPSESKSRRNHAVYLLAQKVEKLRKR